MTFWERIQKALYEKRISEAELSRLVGLTQASITGWKNGAYPRVDIALKVARILDTSVEYLINGENPEVSFKNPKTGKTIPLGSNYFLVPILNQELSAGHGDELPDDDEKIGLFPVPKELHFLGEDLGILVVHGDSMEPTFRNGDAVICDSRGWDNEEGLYAIRLNGKGYIKRIQVGVGKILIKSDNPKYSAIEEPLESDNFNIIGRVWYSITKEF